MAHQAPGYCSAPGWHAGIVDVELVVVPKGLQQGIDLEPHNSRRGAARGVKLCLASAHLR